MPEGKRAEQGFSVAETMARSHDADSQSLVTLAGAFAPDYSAAKTVAGIAANMADPNAAAPPDAQLFPSSGHGKLAWFCIFDATATADVTVWKRTSANGWIIVQEFEVADNTDRVERFAPSGQSTLFIQIHNHTNLAVAVTVDIVAVPVG